MKKLDLEKVKEISNLKKEPKWMCDFRINAYKKFIQLKNPTFGPKIKLDFDIINYYKKVSDDIYDDWQKVDKKIKNTFDDEKYQKDITNFLEDKGCMEDGHASERVVDLIEQIMKEEV